PAPEGAAPLPTLGSPLPPGILSPGRGSRRRGPGGTLPALQRRGRLALPSLPYSPAGAARRARRSRRVGHARCCKSSLRRAPAGLLLRLLPRHIPISDRAAIEQPARLDGGPARPLPLLGPGAPCGTVSGVERTLRRARPSQGPRLADRIGTENRPSPHQHLQ